MKEFLNKYGEDMKDLKIESLRQQLSAAIAACKLKDESLASAGILIDSLQQQLADHIKHNVMLRDALHAIAIEIATENLSAITVIKKCFRMADEALAATEADLGGLILCEREPVAYWCKHSADKSTDQKLVMASDIEAYRWLSQYAGDAAEVIPLYRAKEQGK